MSFEADITVQPFQTKYLSIDAESVIYHDTQMMIADITGFAYGPTINRSPTGIRISTAYNFKFYDTSKDYLAFKIYNGSLIPSTDALLMNEKIIGNIWHYIGNRLLVEMIRTIHFGENIRIGDCLLNRLGVSFCRTPLFGNPTDHTIRWDDIALEFGETNLIIISASDPQTRTKSGMSFHHDLNTHVFQAMCGLIGQGRLAVDVLLGKQAPLV